QTVMAINSSNPIVPNNSGLKTVLNIESYTFKGRDRSPKCRYISSIEREQKRKGIQLVAPTSVVHVIKQITTQLFIKMKQDQLEIYRKVRIK
ncbi:17344_t:CDS:2, partial [Gigaspora margarita]